MSFACVLRLFATLLIFDAAAHINNDELSPLSRMNLVVEWARLNTS